MGTGGGGWIVIQRRMDATVDFYRGWNDYKVGFGNLNGNFWLGLEKIHKLAAPGKRAILRVDMKHYSNKNNLTYARYSTFEVSDEADGYRLKVQGYSGNAGDSLIDVHSSQSFSTMDKDQDIHNKSCADMFRGGWWYGQCHRANLNGLFPTSEDDDGPKYMGWHTLHNAHGLVIFSEMKIKFAT